MDESLSLQAEAEAEALALAEMEMAGPSIQGDTSNVAPPNPPALDYATAVGSGLLDGVKGAITGIPDTASYLMDVAQRGNGKPGVMGSQYFSEMVKDASEALYGTYKDRGPAQAISQGVGGVVSNIPVAGPFLAGTIQATADMSDAITGRSPGMDPTDVLHNASQVVSATGALPATVGLAKKAVGILPESLQNIGNNDAAVFGTTGSGAAGRPGVLASIQNAPDGTTAAKAQKMFDTVPFEDNLLKSGVLKDLDTSKGNRGEVFQQYLKRLDDWKVAAKETKAGIVQDADKAGLKISLPKVNQSELNSLIKKDLLSEFTEKDALVTQQIKGELIGTFEKDTGLVDPSGQPLMIQREYTPSQVQTMIQGIDERLEELGTFDRNTVAQALAGNDSKYANLRTRIEALKAVRKSLSQALVDSVGALGDDAKLKLAQANLDIQTAIEYGGIGKLFYSQTNQSLTPGSGRSANNVLSPSLRGVAAGTIRDALTPESAPMYTGLQREATAIDRMRLVAGARGVPGFEPIPNAKDFILAGTRSMSNGLAPVYNALVLNELTHMGVITPEEQKSGVNASTLPPEAVSQAIAMTDQKLSGVKNAMDFGTEEDVKFELSNVVSSIPYAFPPPKTGIPGEIEVDGKPMLVAIPDRELYTRKVKDSSLSEIEKTRILHELNKSGKVLKVVK